MTVVRMGAGDIAPEALGRIDYHENLLMRSPLLRGDELVDVDASAAEATDLRTAGIDALAELTPIGLAADLRPSPRSPSDQEYASCSPPDCISNPPSP